VAHSQNETKEAWIAAQQGAPEPRKDIMDKINIVSERKPCKDNNHAYQFLNREGGVWICKKCGSMVPVPQKKDKTNETCQRP